MTPRAALMLLFPRRNTSAPGRVLQRRGQAQGVCILAFGGIAGVFLVAPCPDGDEPDQPALVLSSPSFRSRLR